MDGQGNVSGVKVLDRAANKTEEMRADVVVNATGAWAGEITGMAGLDVPVKPTPGDHGGIRPAACPAGDQPPQYSR